MYGFNRTYISTRTTVGAFIRINFINITLRNSFYRAFINASTACGAIIINYVSHVSIVLIISGKVKSFFKHEQTGYFFVNYNTDYQLTK